MTDEPEPLRPDTHIARRLTIGKAAAAIVVALLAVMWLYAASPWSRREPPATLDDATFGEQAEAVCSDTLAPIDDLPFASEARSPQERAEFVDQGNEVVADLIPRLRAIEVAGEHDQALVTQWLADWEELLRNRRAYADVLRAGRDEPFRVTGFAGEPLDASMAWFAQVNRMPSCAPPLDV